MRSGSEEDGKLLIEREASKTKERSPLLGSPTAWTGMSEASN